MQFSRARVAVTITVTALLFTGATAFASPSDAATRALSRFDDGSFEYQKAPANSFSELGTGQGIGPWQVTSGTVDLIGAGFWQAAEGDQSVDLNGSGPGTIAQSFTTTAGTAYRVSYDLAGNPQLGPSVKTGKALIDGQDFQDFSFDITGKSSTDMGYVGRAFTFVATGSSTTLAFTATSPGAAGPVLDNVQVQACNACPSC